MRPGRARPGYDSDIRRMRPQMIGFNEAGARAPRILGARSTVSAWHTARFNEAGARAPRIRGIRTIEIRLDPASMRPGRARPGYKARKRTFTLELTGFNEAGARAPRIPGMLEILRYRPRRLQ